MRQLYTSIKTGLHYYHIVNYPSEMQKLYNTFLQPRNHPNDALLDGGAVLLKRLAYISTP